MLQKKGGKAELPIPPAPSLYLQGKSPTDYLLHVLRAVRSNDLEEVPVAADVSYVLSLFLGVSCAC